MPIDSSEVWSRLLAQVQAAVSDDVFRTWLEPLIPISWNEPVLTLSVPDQFSLEWIESKYAELITSYAPVALGHPVSLTFHIDVTRQARPQMDLFAAKPTQPNQQHNSATIRPLLNDRYTFEHFVVGKSNELAAAAAHAVAQAPGRVYNPFFIYGRTGLGKTHLMQAIAHDLVQSKSSLRITYLSTEQFTNELVASIQNRRTSEFRRRFRETDLLLIDDIHFLKGKEGTQEEFFHTFNALYEAGRQIVLTSDRPPVEIGGLEARLISRFQWGMVADIEPPDIEHRIAILQHKTELDHLDLTFPHDVIQYIAETVHSSIRELEGSIIKILAYASLKHRPIDLHVAKEALHSITTPHLSPNLPGDKPTVLAVQQAVATAWGVTVEGLCSKTRTKTLTIPRQIAMYLLRELLNMQLIEIGRVFGGRDHSTVIHSLNRAQQLITTNKDIYQRYHFLHAQFIQPVYPT
jgi:chromosomal replication initiator protein